MSVKCDLVMWTKNGEKTLEAVLDRIAQVIPKENINLKLCVDDGSTDRTRDILFDRGWMVCDNPASGISGAANHILQFVQTPVFCSFEQDLLLSPDWWKNIKGLLTGDVAVASGVRLSSYKPLAAIQKYAIAKHRSPMQGATLDNTMYSTEAVRNLGGFPVMSRAGVDAAMFKKIASVGLKWKVDFNTVSLHLHEGLDDEVHRYYWYGQSASDLTDHSVLRALARCLFSPVRAVQIAWKQKNLHVLYVYPLIRHAYFIGSLKSLWNRR